MVFGEICFTTIYLFANGLLGSLLCQRGHRKEKEQFVVFPWKEEREQFENVSLTFLSQEVTRFSQVYIELQTVISEALPG